MKKLIIIALLFSLIGCRQSNPVFLKFIERSWGAIGLLPGWKIEHEDNEKLILRSKDEVFLRVFVSIIDKPSDISGFVKSQTSLTGRIYDSERETTIGGIKTTAYKTTAKHGKKDLEEELYLFDIGDKLLAVNSSWPIKSKAKGEAQSIIESLSIKGGK